MLRGKKLLCLMFLRPFVAGRAEDVDPDRIYTQAEVASIDRENKLLRLVNATETVDANVQRLLAAGFPAAVVEALKPRLASMWEVQLLPEFGWLNQDAVTKIQALEPEYTVRMREARVREAIFRLGGEHEPMTPGQVYARWRLAILQLLDERESREFFLMNSPAARAVAKWTKDVPLTVAERRELCELQQDFYRIKNLPAHNGWEIAEREEALLSHWQLKRTLLGDDRFAVYLQAADPGFGRMVGVLNQIGGATNSTALELWWIRKKYEIARRQATNRREALQMEAEVSAKTAALLGEAKFALLAQGEAAQWAHQ